MSNVENLAARVVSGAPRVAVQALIYSSSMRPEEVTTKLQIVPTATAEKGVKHGQRTGTAIEVPRHMWQLSSELNVLEPNLAKHLNWVLTQLFRVRNELQALRARSDTTIELVGIVWTSGTTAHCRLTSEIVEMLAALRLELHLEFADYGQGE